MQSTQSPATIALRALVMLAFIVGIPLLAFNDSSLPERAKKTLEKIWPALASAISAKTANILPEAPRFDVKSQNSPAGQTLSGISNLSGQPTANNQPNLLNQLASGGGKDQFGQPASNVVPVDYQSAVKPTNDKICGGLPSGTNQFMAMQDRLRQLGATYYLLETWGNQRQFFRFYCQMAVGGNSGYSHYFEAINANPLQAMADVLAQVEQWRGGGNSVR